MARKISFIGLFLSYSVAYERKCNATSECGYCFLRFAEQYKLSLLRSVNEIYWTVLRKINVPCGCGVQE